MRQELSERERERDLMAFLVTTSRAPKDPDVRPSVVGGNS